MNPAEIQGNHTKTDHTVIIVRTDKLHTVMQKVRRIYEHTLTLLARDKMDGILQTTFSSAFLEWKCLISD